MGRKIVLGGAGLALLLVVMFIALPAYGLMAPISLEELVKGSSHIVIGKAADITCRWADPWTEEEDYGIYTYVTPSVDEYIKGESQDRAAAIGWRKQAI